MPSMPVKISGTGRFLPEKILTNKDFEALVSTTDQWIRERTGIKERHIAGEGESTATMAAEASRNALADAGLKPTEIDMIIVATITPECFFPSTACFVQDSIGANSVPSFDISAACSGYIYALLLGAQFLQNEQYRHVLIIGSETMSRITDYQDRSSCILFGDGAGAVVLSSSKDPSGPCILHSKMHASGANSTMLWVPAGGSRLPTSEMTVRERLHYIKMQGREVYKVAVKKNIEVIERTLAEAGVSPEELAVVIPHQSNLRIIDSAREKLGLPKEKMFTNIQNCGNTSAASIAMGLDECRKTGRLTAGDIVLMVAFGAGWTWASALIRM
ncbi:MAG: ketoacyl-ACP synthase III [Planctomycetota bacterium]|nr:ketoacyl-ACP synthase III [Planctomycetota bacterium]